MRDCAGLNGAHDGEVLLQLHLPVVVRVDLPQDAGIMKAFMSSCHGLQERVLAFPPARNVAKYTQFGLSGTGYVGRYQNSLPSCGTFDINFTRQMGQY